MKIKVVIGKAVSDLYTSKSNSPKSLGILFEKNCRDNGKFFCYFLNKAEIVKCPIFFTLQVAKLLLLHLRRPEMKGIYNLPSKLSKFFFSFKI